jgi:hypothetical protein
MNLFGLYCKQNGIDVMSKPPVTVFPEQDKPRIDVAQVQQEFQDRYNEIMKRYGLDYLNGARSGMIPLFFNIIVLLPRISTLMWRPE